MNKPENLILRQTFQCLDVLKGKSEPNKLCVFIVCRVVKKLFISAYKIGFLFFSFSNCLSYGLENYNSYQK